MSEHPEDLLRGALEKIVFFECRLSQLEAELGAARDVASREKEAAAQARAREVALEARVAQARADLEGAGGRARDLEERVRLLEAERERFLGGLIDQARIAAAPRQGEGPADGERADLAGFIAEMRGEIERLRPWKAAAERAGIRLDGEPRPLREPRGPEPVPALAARFGAAGRLGLSPSEVRRLGTQLPTRAERSLHQKSVDDLGSFDAGARRRAADCLRALGSKAAAPLVVAAVGREEDAEVKAALLAALAALGEPSTADVARRALADARPQVRGAALDAVAALAASRAEPDLVRALADSSPLVRRRAVLLLGFAPGAAAEEALSGALGDENAGVARAAALALSGRPSARAQGALARALDHREPSVRRAAAAAVARWSGEAVDPGSSAEDRRRAARRIADKLAALGEGSLREAVIAGAEGGARSPAEPARAAAPDGVAASGARSVAAMAAVAAAPAAVAASPAAPAGVAAAPPSAPAPAPLAAPALFARGAVAVLEGAGPLRSLEEAVVVEVRAALRGLSLDELGAVVPGGRAAVEAALRSLVARGALTRRGARFFAS